MMNTVLNRTLDPRPKGIGTTEILSEAEAATRSPIKENIAMNQVKRYTNVHVGRSFSVKSKFKNAVTLEEARKHGVEESEKNGLKYLGVFGVDITTAGLNKIMRSPMNNKTPEEAIQTIRKNWPDERYTMLREALEYAITAIEENTELVKALEHLATKPIGVFGEGFGWEEHYKWLKQDLKHLLSELRGGTQ